MALSSRVYVHVLWLARSDGKERYPKHIQTKQNLITIISNKVFKFLNRNNRIILLEFNGSSQNQDSPLKRSSNEINKFKFISFATPT